MVMNLKVFLAVLASLALVGCPDDETEEDSAYTLKVDKPSSPAVGTAFDVVVNLHKDKKLVTGEDAKSAKDSAVSGSIKCKEGSKIDATGAKFNDAGKATLSITIADNSDKDGTNIGEKGYSDCVVSASAEIGKDKTKASGDSEKFTVAAKTEAAGGGGGGGDNPAFPTGGIKSGKEFSIANGKGKKISLVKDDGTTFCDTADNFLFKVGAPVVPITEEQAIAESTDKFFVIGIACDVKVEDIAANADVTAGTSVSITVVKNAGTGTNMVGISVPAITGNVTTSNAFVKIGDDDWEAVTITSSHPWGTDASNDIETTKTPDDDANANQALLNINGLWSYAKI